MSNPNSPVKQDPRQAQIEHYLSSLNTRHTRDAYARHLTRFLTWFDAQGQAALTRRMVQAYKSDLIDQGAAASVVNQALSAIRGFVREMADSGYLPHLQATTIISIKNVPDTPLPAGRNIEADEITTLLQTCYDDPRPQGLRDAALIALMRVTGLRRSEVARLRLEDIDLADSRVAIIGGKGNKSREAFIDAGTKELLLNWLDYRGLQTGPLFNRFYKGDKLGEKGLSPSSIYYVLEQRWQQAGLEQMTPHDFRRTIIGDLLSKGEDISTVAQIVGHSDVSTTARYDRRGTERKREAANRIVVPVPERRASEEPS